MEPIDLIYSSEEMKALFVNHLRELCRYWATQQDEAPKPIEELILSAYYSLLASIDGSSDTLPGFALIPIVTQDDADFFTKTGERTWPVVEGITSHPFDIAGDLARLLHQDDATVAISHHHVTVKEWMETTEYSIKGNVYFPTNRKLKEEFINSGRGLVLGFYDEFTRLAMLAIKHGFRFVWNPREIITIDSSFKFMGNDHVSLINFMKELNGSVIMVDF